MYGIHYPLINADICSPSHRFQKTSNTRFSQFCYRLLCDQKGPLNIAIEKGPFFTDINSSEIYTVMFSVATMFSVTQWSDSPSATQISTIQYWLVLWVIGKGAR